MGTDSMYLDKVTAGYRSGWRLGPVTTAFNRGVTALIGPNGAGKTTLMRVLTGTLRPRSGVVMRDGDALHRRSQWSRHRATLGYVPQECRWTQSWRVGEFVEFCAAMYRVPRAEITARSEKALAAVGADELLGSRLGALSGGQRQRVFLAAALVHDPEVLVLDEPTVGLDPGERISFREHLVGQSESRAVILSTHLMDDVALAADEVKLLATGRIVWHGSVDELVAAGEDSGSRNHLSAAERGYLNLTGYTIGGDRS